MDLRSLKHFLKRDSLRINKRELLQGFVDITKALIEDKLTNYYRAVVPTGRFVNNSQDNFQILRHECLNIGSGSITYRHISNCSLIPHSAEV